MEVGNAHSVVLIQMMMNRSLETERLVVTQYTVVLLLSNEESRQKELGKKIQMRSENRKPYIFLNAIL